MRKKFFALTALVALLIVSIVTGCGGTKPQSQSSSQSNAAPVKLTISAAASLQDVAQQLKTMYEKQHPGVTITYNFGASGPLQKQIEQGAPADMFISAGDKQMDALDKEGLLQPGSRKNLLGNDLVLVVPQNSTITSFADLSKPGIGKISIGTPASVPAGEYAQETLTSMNLWKQLEPNIVYGKDVRQVLTYVENGNVAAGMVYRSDALVGKGIKVVAAAPDSSHKPITYPMAIIKSSKQQKAAADFATFLSGSDAGKVFVKYGFKLAQK